MNTRALAEQIIAALEKFQGCTPVSHDASGIAAVDVVEGVLRAWFDDTPAPGNVQTCGLRMDGLYCTKRVNHSGDHVAHTTCGNEVGRWRSGEPDLYIERDLAEGSR